MSPKRDRTIQLLRLIPGESPLHRTWPGTKLAAVVALGLAATIRPTWTAVAVIAVSLALGFVAARVPLSAFPIPPTWLGAAIVATGVIAVFAGGEPDLAIGPVSIGMGGFLEWLRLTTLVFEAFLAAALIGWTTHLGDLGGAVAVIMSPLRRIGVPVDSAIATSTLGLRCLPLLLDEFRTLLAAWRNRRPLAETRAHTASRERFREGLVQAHDILMAAMSSALRRAQEMAQAMDARGGLEGPASGRLSFAVFDALVVVLALGGAAVILLA